MDAAKPLIKAGFPAACAGQGAPVPVSNRSPLGAGSYPIPPLKRPAIPACGIALQKNCALGAVRLLTM
jgi:hypothetical protein